jgi:hypothetical protein
MVARRRINTLELLGMFAVVVLGIAVRPALQEAWPTGEIGCGSDCIDADVCR